MSTRLWRQSMVAGSPFNSAIPGSLSDREAGWRNSRFAMLLLVVICGLSTDARAGTINRIVAVVNDEAITAADVEEHLNTLLDQQQAAPANADPEQMRQAILRRLIEQRLILQEARRSGIVVNMDEIAKRLDELRSQFDSDEGFQQSLEAAHLSRERLKEQLRDQLMVQRVIDTDVRSTILVSPQDVARELGAHPELARSGDRVRASHILIRVNESRPEAKAQALSEDIHRQLTGGADFAALAKRYSEDPHRDEGGAMGWVAQGELMPELDSALFGLQVGELSVPIRTRLGFHLLKIEERRTASSLSLMEANHAVYQQLYQKKFQEVFNRWLNGLMQRAYIQILA